MANQQIADIMTKDVVTTREDDTIANAAKLMAQQDVGVLPVTAQNNELVGMITDRDIVVGAVAVGKDPSKTTVGEVRSGETVSVTSEDSVERATQLMSEHQIRRLPVVQGRTVIGIVSQADVARSTDPQKVGRMVGDISEP